MSVLGVARRDFDAKASEVREARHFVAAEARGWGVESSALETVVGELAANAYVHARTAFTVSLCYHDECLSVEVADRSPALPVPSAGDPRNGSTGRGLKMVDSLVKAWGARSTIDGKILWAELVAVQLANRGG